MCGHECKKVKNNGVTLWKRGIVITSPKQPAVIGALTYISKYIFMISRSSKASAYEFFENPDE